MKASLSDQLLMLTRTVNPNYLIIVKNKANETMDFTQFKPVIYNTTPYKPTKRYTINHKELEDGNVLITVIDNFLNGREVFRSTCKDYKLEENLEAVKKLYKGCSIEDKIL